MTPRMLKLLFGVAAVEDVWFLFLDERSVKGVLEGRVMEWEKWLEGKTRRVVR